MSPHLYINIENQSFVFIFFKFFEIGFHITRIVRNDVDVILPCIEYRDCWW